MLRVSIKTLAVPIFRAKECTRTHDIVLKYFFKFMESHPAAGAETFSHTHPPIHAHPPNAGYGLGANFSVY